jgi:hypothetical protein
LWGTPTWGGGRRRISSEGGGGWADGNKQIETHRLVPNSLGLMKYDARNFFEWKCRDRDADADAIIMFTRGAVGGAGSRVRGVGVGSRGINRSRRTDWY